MRGREREARDQRRGRAAAPQRAGHDQKFTGSDASATLRAMQIAMIVGVMALGVLTSACKSEKEKMVEEWEAKVCAAKDRESASKELLKYEKWLDDKKGWTDKEVDARQAAYKKATECVAKLGEK
jgi:hypothetical protein